MPLRCLAGDSEEILAFQQTHDSWETLKANYRHQNLKMVCCGMPAIPKTSSLGTYFFAHTCRGDCTSAPETKEHLLAKTIIAKTALATGWKVTTEFRGETPTGKTWIADVLAVCGNARVAFEIQWSSQKNNETAERQKIYKESDVRCLWLFRQCDFDSSQETPAFNLLYNDQEFTVRVPVTSSYSALCKRENSYPGDWMQEIPLAEFVMGAINKQLVWRPLIGKTLPLHLQGWKRECWRCHGTTQTLQHLIVNPKKVFPGYPEYGFSIYDFESCPEILESLLPLEFLRRHGIGKIRNRSSKYSKGEYLANNCIHCDALQDRYFEDYYNCHQGVFFYDNIRPIADTEITLTSEFVSKLLAPRYGKSSDWLNKWYFVRQIKAD